MFHYSSRVIRSDSLILREAELWGYFPGLFGELLDIGFVVKPHDNAIYPLKFLLLVIRLVSAQ